MKRLTNFVKKILSDDKHQTAIRQLSQIVESNSKNYLTWVTHIQTSRWINKPESEVTPSGHISCKHDSKVNRHAAGKTKNQFDANELPK